MNLSPCPPPARRSQSGAALILTMAMLVLLSALVLAYLLTVRTEFSASKAYEAGTSARLLADSALNRVIAQIREGTTQPAGQPIQTWISQPGLIRTFDNSGAPVKAYKLYSADSLIEAIDVPGAPGSFNPALAPDLPDTDSSKFDYWKKQPALWTDLNAPVADLTQKVPRMIYPIFDANHLKLAVDLTKATSTPGTVTSATGSLQLSLNDDKVADIEGFKVTDKYADGGASMPVKWLYVLKDGTLVPAKASGTAGDIEVVVPTTPVDKTKTAQGDFNGVVGRIAFWTDDESTKVNVNTASEGTYWDTPVGASQPGKPVWQNAVVGGWHPTYDATKPGTLNTYVSPYVKTLPKNGAALTPAALAGVDFTPNDATFEWEYMHMTPGQKEYQRYTGHPATTCLSTIFGRQLMLRLDPTNDPKLFWKTRAKMCEEIYKMIPRVTGLEYDKNNDPQYAADQTNFPADPLVPKENTTYPGVWIPKNYTSLAGTGRPKIGEIMGQPLPAAPPVVTPDTDRLYASVDEFVYNPNFTAAATSADKRNGWVLTAPDPAAVRDKTREMLEMSRFFLTANSKSPEQNSFNLPRVSIWPESAIASNRTAFDKAFAFCSTIRDPANSANNLPFYFTRENYGAAAGVTDDYQSSQRNVQLMTYLTKLTSTAVPGWKLNGAPASFAAKYGTDHPQILAEIFDYIRCTNLCDMSAPSSPGVFPAFYAGKFSKPHGSVNPIEISPTARGMGRNVTISEMTLHVARLPDWTAPLSYGKNLSASPYSNNANEDNFDGKAPDGIYQFTLLPSLYSVMAGYSVLDFNVRLTFRNIKFTVQTYSTGGTLLGTYYPFQGKGTSTWDNTNSAAADFDQPTLFTDGLASKFYYAYGGQLGYRALLRSNNASFGGHQLSCPPNALLRIRNIYPKDPISSPVKITVSGTFDVDISSPATSNATNTTGEPIIQTLHFNFPKFTSLLPWSHYNNVVLGGPGNSTAWFGAPGNPHAFPLVTASAGSPLVAVSGGKYFKDNESGTSDDLFQGTNGGGLDIVRQLQPTGSNVPFVASTVGIQGDVRLIAGLKDVPATYFQPCSNYRPVSASPPMTAEHTMTAQQEMWGNAAGGSSRGESGFKFGQLVNGLVATAKQTASIPYRNPSTAAPNATTGAVTTDGTLIQGVKNFDSRDGDWDRGPFLVLDGALCNKADEGGGPQTGFTYRNTLSAYMSGGLSTGNNTEYLDDFQSSGLFSPNRQIASAVMFGSLPTGVIRARPWQTLLFRPAKYYWPGVNGTNTDTVQHPGSAKYGPPDHLLLDLFWMPVVEPYPISEPFATGGKVNLNQQIVPFTNIQRDTALRAVLKSVKITAINPNQLTAPIPPAVSVTYITNSKISGESLEGQQANGGGHGVINRRTIDLDNTLKQINDRLVNNQPFVSASEICDIPLIPKDVPLLMEDTASEQPMPAMQQHASALFAPDTPLSQFDGKLAAFWLQQKLTGDNTLERPYAAIYPRLTTRSNTYTVHVRVQTLTQNQARKSFILKRAETEPTGEFRGSYVVERYLDANSAGIYAKTDTAFANKLKPGDTVIPGTHVLGPYRFRVVSSKQFVP